MPSFISISRVFGLAFATIVATGCATPAPAAGGEAHFERALQYQFSGNVDSAIDEYKRGLESSPDSVDGHTRLGTLLLDERGDVDGAISEFVTALTIDPDCRFCQSRLDEAVSRKNAPSKDGVNRGNDFYRNGQLSRAAAAYRVATSADPSDAEAHNCLAWTLYRLGKLDEAAEEVKEALRLKPEEAEYINTLACILFDQGNVEGSIATFKKAVAKSKTPNPADLYGLSVAFLTKGDKAQAIKYFQDAVKADPSYADVSYIRDKIGMSVHALATHEKLLGLSGQPAPKEASKPEGKDGARAPESKEPANKAGKTRESTKQSATKDIDKEPKPAKNAKGKP